MNWDQIKLAALNLKPAKGGHTAATRGLISLAGGETVFVKLAVDDQTREWIAQELKAYHWLENHDYRHLPKLLAESTDGFALQDLSDWDWSDNWSEPKLNSVLSAMDDLADLSSVAQDEIDHANFGKNPWLVVPQLLEAYTPNVDVEPSWLVQLEKLLADGETRSAYESLASTEPWRGDQLVHYDVRADNFCYDPKTNQGLLVDWNWLSLGNVKLDQTSLLVNVCKSGFRDLVMTNKGRLDLESLAWLIGFCLKAAATRPDSDRLRDLRSHQLKTALVAHDLAQGIMSEEE